MSEDIDCQAETAKGIGFFECYLTVRVGLCIIAGIVPWQAGSQLRSDA